MTEHQESMLMLEQLFRRQLRLHKNVEHVYSV